MENKYLKIVSKKDFNFDEFIQAYLKKHHYNKHDVSYMLSVFWHKDGCGGNISLVENKIKKNGNS